jgi:3-oxoacyl-[acyl-carrier protein] reductase
VALVTGGSGGIGRAIAARLAADGAAVAVAYGRHEGPAQQAAGEIVDAGGRAVAMLRNAYLTNQVISLDGGTYPR